MAAGWGTLSERTETLRGQHLTQEHAIQKCDERVRTVENDRRIETKLAEVVNRLVALEVLVRESIDGKKRR